MTPDKTPAMPESSGSTEGVTQGSLGDASMADLKKGYHAYKDDPVQGEDLPMAVLDQSERGFLSRPHGWER